MAHLENIPGSIVKAICAIQTSMGAVSKSNRNAHGGYNYASADDIYAALTRKMGEVGLAVISLEDHCDIKRFEGKDGKTVQWAHMEFSFILATEDATWSDARCKRTLYIQVTGAQTFQAAQSYAEKAFMRSLFKIPTGDMDLDSMPQADNEDDQVALSSKRKPKSSAEGKRDGSVKVFNEIRAAIANAVSRDVLLQVKTLFNDEWSTMPARWADTLDEDYDVKMMSFAEAAE
jgi:hypothetical protein